jgi:3-hydroxy-9,10-secoandrosta-1,3,5(10)-triene-9,17-dione monooxygenase reductase component
VKTSESVDRYALATAALSQIPHPVVIVAAEHDGERSCATSTVMYVSHAPALVAIAEHPGSRTCRLIETSRALSVSILHAAQQDVAMAAGRSAPGPDKFAALRIPAVDAPRAGLPPGVAGSVAVLWCEVRESRPTGDHVLFVAEVVAHHVDETKMDTLLRFRRRYFNIGHPTSDEAPEGYPT